MKKYIYIAIASLFAFAACEKESGVQEEVTPVEEPVVKEQVTITASIPEDGLATKVAFEEEDSGGGKMRLTKLSWEEGDKLTINGETFTVKTGTISVNGKTADFTGTDPGAGPYNIAYSSLPGDINNQTQKADGDPEYLGYSIALSGASSYTAFEFSSTGATALGATFTQSSVLQLRAVLPAAVASSVQKVIFKSSKDDLFGESNTLKVELESSGTAGDDNTLDIYAALPAGADVTLDDKMDLLIQFQTSENEYDKYTAYREFPASTHFIIPGRTQYIGINCANIESYANKSNVDIGTSGNPYLIGDQHQLAKINSYASTTSISHISLIDDIDMQGKTHTPINEDIDDFAITVSFDGSGKRISHLATSLFYVFKGTVQNLTLSDCNVGTSRGIFAEYCQGTGHSITKVDIDRGEISGTPSNVGALIGNINNGSAGVTIVTISDCEISNTTVSGTGVVGGVIGYANGQVEISGCKFTSGTVTASGQYVGGFIGSAGNYASSITDCQVEATTVNVNSTADARGGGFAGIIQDNVTVSGCTVGTSSTKVTVNTKEPTIKSGTTYNVINVGGFVGVCYGTITKNGSVRSKAYAKITSTNTIGTPLKLGGFVGYHSGTIEYSDAIVDMSGLKGQHIGGFAGYITTGSGVRYGMIDNCTADGTVSGNNYTGGFIGYLEGSGNPPISNCTASGTVSGQSGCGGFVGQTMTGVFTGCSTSMTCSFSGSNNGGFAGQIHGGSMTSCHSDGNITETGSGSIFGGFVGLIPNGTVSIQRCYATGDVTSDGGTTSSFIGSIAQGTDMTLSSVTIENCYATGDIINSNQIRGGLIARIQTVTSATISNCYSSGAVVGSFRLGGLIGSIESANVSVQNCAAWNSAVTASSVGSGNWSSGAVVGTAYPSCMLTDNYRKSDIALKAFWGNVTGYTFELTSDYQHANVDGSDSSTYLVVKDKSTGVEAPSTTATLSGGNYPIFPYHGKVEIGKTLSQLASTTLGWSSSIWDFSTDLPTLK